MKLKYQVPDFYNHLLPRDLLHFTPQETKATCNNCAMAPGNHKGPKFYQPDLKCCTFEPFIPNFLVGATFLDPKATKAHAILRDKIHKRRYSLPVGMVASVRYQIEFNQNKEEIFGQDSDYLCAYYDRGTELCTLWRHRGVVCTTFYCKSSYGKKGLQFWNDLSDYLALFEMALMEESLVMLDFSPRQVSKLVSYLNRQEGTQAELRSWCLPEGKAKELWNGYYEEQETFFKKAFQIAANLDRKAIKELMGEHGRQLETKVLEQIERLQSYTNRTEI